VKGGMAGGAPAQAFTRDRLEDAVRRIGAIQEGSIADLCVRLVDAPSAECGRWVFVKLVIAEAPVEGCFVSLPLRDAERFVRNRLRSHIDRKRGDWVQFRDPVIQLLAWEECRRG
jgi:hypothetical protein